MANIENAYNELKRVDHLIFVTLKYTRTVDVIYSVIERLISTLDFASTGVLDWAIEKGTVSTVPTVDLLKCQKIEEVFPKDKAIKDIVDFYCMLRRIKNSDYKKKEEYRKNVALVTEKDEINIEKLKEYAEITKEYVQLLQKKVEEE